MTDLLRNEGNQNGKEITIKIENLVKRFGNLEVLKGINLEVKKERSDSCNRAKWWWKEYTPQMHK